MSEEPIITFSIVEKLLARMEAVNGNVSVFKSPRQFFCMQDVGEFGLAISRNLAVAFLPVEVIPMH